MSECIEWEGRLNSDGYGALKIAGMQMLAHRVVWMQDNGHTDLHVLHSCDNRKCINIEHLRAGTNDDNIADKIKRGRHQGQRAVECPQGHAYTAENTYINKKGNRSCRTCRNTVAPRRYRNGEAA